MVQLKGFELKRLCYSHLLLSMHLYFRDFYFFSWNNLILNQLSVAQMECSPETTREPYAVPRSELV